MEFFAPIISFNWTLVMQLINTLIICLLLGKFLVKPVHELVRKRQDGITSSMREAELKNQEALQLKATYEEKLKDAGRESRKLINEAKEKADVNSRRVLDLANKRTEELKRQAEMEIEEEKHRKVNEAKDEIVGMAVFMAQKILEKELDQDKQKDFVNQMLEEVQSSDDGLHD